MVFIGCGYGEHRNSIGVYCNSVVMLTGRDSKNLCQSITINSSLIAKLRFHFVVVCNLFGYF